MMPFQSCLFLHGTGYCNRSGLSQMSGTPTQLLVSSYVEKGGHGQVERRAQAFYKYQNVMSVSVKIAVLQITENHRNENALWITEMVYSLPGGGG